MSIKFHVLINQNGQLDWLYLVILSNCILALNIKDCQRDVESLRVAWYVILDGNVQVSPKLTPKKENNQIKSNNNFFILYTKKVNAI